jgi:endonuclease/exonuclease/phosphatase family metal-dependent hydrolase
MLLRISLAILFSMSAHGEALRVLSFNVRYPSPQDGPNLWDKRKDLLVDTIRRLKPHLIGTQELFKMQGDYIVSNLPEYTWFGTSRRGNSEDEHMGVFYRKSDLKLVEQGQFWLSESPDVPGSQSWNMSLPRMVTWGLFELRNGRRFYFLNTHFAHRREDEEARKKSAAVIAARLPGIRKGLPVIVTGDFNAAAGGEVHRAMLSTGLIDTRDTAKETAGPDGTSHGFRGTPRSRIDWILVSPEWSVLRNETITYSVNELYPSDHFPVIAEIELQAK